MPETIQREEMPENNTGKAETENVHQRQEENQDYVEGGKSPGAYILEIWQPCFTQNLAFYEKQTKKLS